MFCAGKFRAFFYRIGAFASLSIDYKSEADPKVKWVSLACCGSILANICCLQGIGTPSGIFPRKNLSSLFKRDSFHCLFSIDIFLFLSFL